MNNQPDAAWELCTWEGNRRSQIRHGLSLTLRQRLQAVEDMADLARHFEHLRAQGKFKPASREPDSLNVQSEEK